jgi:hypothetical protein
VSPAEISAQAIMVSQHTCLAVLGVQPRRFRELVLEVRIRHTRLGKLVLVGVADWMSVMAKLSTTTATTTAPEPEPIASVSDMLAALGRRAS